MQGVTNETAGSSESGFSFNDVMTMLILDVFIYAVLSWYATNVSGEQNTSFPVLTRMYAA